MVRICKRTTSSKNQEYTLDYIDVEVFDINDELGETVSQQSIATVTEAPETTTSQQELTDQVIPLQTSVMAAIDVMQNLPGTF